MLPRFHLSDISTLTHHLGTLVVCAGVLMFAPLIVALLFGEYASAVDFAFGIGVCLFAGTALRLFKAYRVDRRCSLLLTGFSWVAVGLVSAIPMLLSGSYGSFVDALFDSVSSITTTGVSLAADLDAMSYSQIVWHATLTLAGGQAVIFIAVYFGFSGEGSFAFAATTRGYSELVSSNRTWGASGLVAIPVLFTALATIGAFCIGIYLGFEPAAALVDAFSLAANAVNTGGFVPHTSNLVYYHSIGLDAFLLVFIMLGMVNAGVMWLAFRGRFSGILKNSEFRLLVAWTIVFVICVAVGLGRDAVYTTAGALIDRGLFTAVTAVGTSGMQTVYPEQLATCFSDGVVILLALAMFFGASACSATGGIKMLRVMVLLRWLGYTIFRAILPDSARLGSRYDYFGAKSLTSEAAMHAMTIIILYLAAAALGAMAFIAHGNDALASVVESISYVSNDGLTAGITGPGMPLTLKVVAILQMWAGRLEFIALIAALAGIVISIRPFPRRAGALRSTGAKAPRRRAAGGMFVALCLVLAGAPSLALAAPQGGPQVPASQVEGLQSQEVESYRSMDIEDLLTATSRLEGRRVKVSGVVYGTAVNAGAEQVWLNIKSDGAMIGVLATREQAAQVATFGSYNATGDTVEVHGVYHLACAEHDGELDVHVDELAVTAHGGAVAHEPDQGLLAAAAILAIAAVVLVFVKRLLYGRERRKRALLRRWLRGRARSTMRIPGEKGSQ